jgi:hypothetical protein
MHGWNSERNLVRLIKYADIMLIKDHKEIDDFFLEKVWNNEERENVHNFSMNILNVYVQCLAKILNLSFQDTYNMTRGQSYEAISSFIDATYRLKNKNLIPLETSETSIDLNETLSDLFKNINADTPLTSSRILRCRLTNTILHTFGVETPLFWHNPKEPKELKYKDLNLNIDWKEKYWKIYYLLTQRIPHYAFKLFQSKRAKIKKVKRKDLLRIGTVSLDEKFMQQLPDIQWVPIEIKLDRYTNSVGIEYRYNLFYKLREEFLYKLGELSEWDIIVGDANIPTKFFDILLAFIVIKSESLICKKKQLHQAIDYCESILDELNIRAIYAQVNIRTFENTIITTAGRKLQLSLLEAQCGGVVFQRNGQGFDIEGNMDTSSDHIFAWGGDRDSNKKSKHPIYHRIPNPFLFNQFNSYKRRKRRGDKLKILYTPMALSGIYSTVNWLSMSTYDMKDVRNTVDIAFASLDSLSIKDEMCIYVKIKGFSSKIFQGHSYMTVPQIKLNNICIKHLLYGDSSHYLSRMDVHVSCSNATTFVYSMNYNMPTIILWNDAFRVKDKYNAFFDDLVKVGIICIDPHSFCNNFSLISDNHYWFSEEVQKVRSKFCHEFGYTSKNWKEEFNIAILNALK